MEQATCDVFVSFAQADREWVEGYLLDALTQAGVRHHSEATFALGVPRLLEFERAIRQCHRTLLVLSPAYLADGLAGFADLLAQSFGLETATWPVIPLVLRPVRLPPRLALLTSLDATDPEHRVEALARLCAEFQRPLPAPAPPPPCPYPGMVPFAETDSDRFFGRDQQVSTMLQLLRLYPFLTVIGPSGSGKSSLAFAGLVPALRRSTLFGPGAWLVRSLRPGPTPLAELGRVLGADPADPAGAVARLLASQPGAARLLLIVDQFEEVFTLGAADAQPFQHALLGMVEAVGASADCSLVLTARADFYADLMATPLWSAIQAHRFEVLPLDAAGLRQAIVQPAEAVGVYVETALVERLIADAAREPGILPLVQETLVLLWEHLERRFLPLRAYDALVMPSHAYGGTDAAPRTGLQVAMARRADAVLAALTPAQQALARRIFLRLVQFGEGRADTRRQQSMDALRAAGDDRLLFEHTLSQLTSGRLLTLSGDQGDANRKVDIAHEALIGGWPALTSWLGERREAEQTRRRLAAKAAEWERLGRGSGGLLDELELSEAERWLAGPDARDLGYDEVLPAAVGASRAAIDRAHREVAATRDRELAQARELAAEQRRLTEEQRLRAEEQTQAARRLRRRAVWLAAATLAAAVLAVAAGGTAVWAVGQQRLALANEQQAQSARAMAESESRISRSRELAASALSQLAFDPELSVLLAAQAVRTDETAEARRALLQALARSHVRTTVRHAGAVTSAAFSPDGARVVTASVDGTAKVWEAATGRLVAELTGHTAVVNAAAFSPDGTHVATVSDDGTARLWEVATGRPIALLKGHPKAVAGVAFSPDGDRVVTTGDDDTARVWEAATGRLVAELTGNTAVVNAAAFSPDGAGMVTTGLDQTVRVWEAATGRLVAELTGHADVVYGAAFSPDGTQVVTASEDGTARVWDVATGKTIVALKGHTDAVYEVAFSPDGGTVLTTGQDGTARVWEAATGTPIAKVEHTGGGAGATFSPDGAAVVSIGRDGTARVWASATGRLIAELTGHTGAVTSAAFSPDGAQVVTAGDDGTARVWEVAIGSPAVELKAHTEDVNSVAFSPNGTQVVTASDDGTARLWAAATGSPTVELKGHVGPVYSAAFSRDGTRIATASDDRTARVWDVATGRLVAELREHTDVVTSVAFSPDGTRVVTTGGHQAPRIWEAATGRLITELTGPDLVASAAFSPDGMRVLTAGGSKTARVWEATTGKPVVGLEGHTDTVIYAAFSPDSARVVTAGVDRTARVWEAATGRLVAELTGHTGSVGNAAFSPDGARVVTASGDGTARVWEAATGRVVAELRGHGNYVTTAAFSPDGARVMTAGGDGTARVWEAATGTPIAELRGHAGPVTSAAFSPDGTRVVTAGADGSARLYICELCASTAHLLSVVPRRVSRSELTREERERFLHDVPSR